MKRKLFTLLLAIGVLTAFQTNAQLKVRFLADTSGLAKTSLGNDSFPRIKKGLYNWLSFSEKISLKTSSDTAKVSVEKKLLNDPSSVFEVKFLGQDSTQFQITPKGGTKAVTLDHGKGSTSLFRILKLKEGWSADDPKDGLLANLFRPEWKDTLAGYLAYVPDPDPEKLKLDTLDVSVGLVGFDKEKKELSIKYFNDFAFYADTLPYMLQSFQYGYDKPGSRKFDPGKLYETDSFPYFQIYDGQGNALLKSSTNWTEDAEFEGGEAINWGYRNPQYGHKANLNDSLVYSWLDIKFDGNSDVILPGYKQDGSGDSSAIVRLDTLLRWVDSIRTAESYVDRVGFDTTYYHRDLIPRWCTNGEKGDSSHVYLKNDNGQLSFTVKLRGDKRESDWTNGYPTLFDYKDSKVYYRADTMLKWVLRPVFEKLFGSNSADSIFRPSKSWQVARYVYKDKNDSWRPLYVRVDSVDEKTEKEKKYEYIGEKWLKDRKLDEVSPEVHITGLSSMYISAGKGNISLENEKGASFKISRVDTIKDKWFAVNKDAYTNDAKKFQIGDSIVELFNISDGNGSLLTVLDDRTFDHPLKNSLGWADTLKENGESVRQMFAIVRDCKDDTYTFLPVAARYEDNDIDTLSFNLAIGRGNDGGQLVSLEGAWHLESSLSYELVVADSISKTEPLKFKLTPSFQPWGGKDGYVTIKNEKGYYRGYSSDYPQNVTANDIAAQWTVKSDGEGEEKTWTFTPVFVDTDGTKTPLAKVERVSAYINDNDTDGRVYLERKTDDFKDTVLIETGYAPEDFDLYSGFGFDWDGKEKGLVTIVSGEKYLAYNDKNEVYYATGTADDSPAITIHRGENVDETLISAAYPVPYYRFSYKVTGKEYYLKAEDEGKISWDETATPEDDHKFYLPKGFDEGKFYLHNHKGHLLQVSKDGSKLSFATEGTVYSTVNNINDATEPATLQWTITKKGDIEDTWAVMPTDEDGTATGVLVIGEEGKTFIGVDGNKGVLSNKTDESVVLKLIQATTLDPQSIVAYSPLRATAETDVPVGYKIIHGDLYLTDEDDDATFSEANTSKKQTFAFKNNEEGDGFAIVLFDNDEDRFLSSTGLNLKFSAKKEDKLSFTWGKAEDYGIITGIKVTGVASAKVYGVAGGVKVANAGGAVSIYTIDGRLVTAQAVTSPDQTVAVPAGIYVVKNGANVAKVVVK